MDQISLLPEFKTFPKIQRLLKPILVTEKIDGTNGGILVMRREEMERSLREAHDGDEGVVLEDVTNVCLVGDKAILAMSRNRYISPDKDNFGFARWVWDNAEQLGQLGWGTHYGEWWGHGIQRGYGFNVLGQRMFSLFNVSRWHSDYQLSRGIGQFVKDSIPAPTCCNVVPVIAEITDLAMLPKIVDILRRKGSFAAPGFPDPEGLMLFLTATGTYLKMPFDTEDQMFIQYLERHSV